MALTGWMLAAVFVHVIIAVTFITLLMYYYQKANTVAVQIATKIDKYLKNYGYDAAPFLPEWYNELSTIVKLNYPPKTVCVVVLSNGDMFDKTLPEYLLEHDPTLEKTKDCIDLCTKHFMQKAVTECYPGEEVDIIYDWELQAGSRLPIVNMSTAGHAAGLAHYNLPQEITNPPWGEQKMFGCSVSPKYGGWFGYRAVLVFKNIQDDKIEYLAPHDAVESQEQKVRLLEAFNKDWKDPAWRDIIYTDKRYSDEQLEYFNTLPSNRAHLINAILDRHKEGEDDKKEM